MVIFREELKDRFDKGKTVKGTQASHHFIPQFTPIISYTPTSEDETFVATFNFHLISIPTIDIMQLKPLISYVSCVYNGFW